MTSTIDPQNIPLNEATGDLRDLLIRLAVEHEHNPARPCCDGDTTLADWIEAGIY
jgi:hypothetical protein